MNLVNTFDVFCYFSYDYLMYNDSINYEGFWGVCDSPCQAHRFFPTPMIGTDGGYMKLRFLSDNVMAFKGWWLEYQLG